MALPPNSATLDRNMPATLECRIVPLPPSRAPRPPGPAHCTPRPPPTVGLRNRRARARPAGAALDLAPLPSGHGRRPLVLPPAPLGTRLRHRRPGGGPDGELLLPH